MSFNLQSYLQAQGNKISAVFNEFLSERDGASQLIQAMSYSFLAGGKRIRPILCLAAVDTVGGDEEIALPAAFALELVHTYSLIHDDLPAMDDDELRRGVQTCHVRFNEATAILAGDALLTLAFEVLANAGMTNGPSAIKWLGITKILAERAGCTGMVEGQMRDILSEGKLLSVDEMKKLHALKTGALIEASLHIGAIVGGASPEQTRHLRRYGRKIGLAFQITDDILNVNGDPKLLGKAVGSDAEKLKNTYPSLLGVDVSLSLVRELIGEALHSLETFNKKALPLIEIASYIAQRNR
ncbi:MAG: polyprenyl synthetase family protein [Desulfobacteraceae bacterium]|nr:polyprenyl synthetase family protein [Desulfobacteraceae bacterium]